MKRLVTFAALAVSSLVSPAAFAQPTASLSSWQTSNGTGVRFVQLTPETVDQPNIDLPDETSDGAYKYGVDTSALAWRPDCTCYRYYVIFTRATSTGVVTRHKFKGIPSGSFVDQRANVRLSITDASPQPHVDDIALPVASAPGLEPSALIEVKFDRPMEPVSLGGVTEIRMTVQNPSAYESIEVSGDVQIEPETRTLWKVPPSLLGSSVPLTLDPRAGKTLTIRLEPAVKEAIGLSFPPTSQDLPHTSIRVDVPYRTRTFSGRDGHVTATIPLRFRPSISTLAMWLLGGVVLGSVLRLLPGKKILRQKWPRAVMTAVLVGIVLELFGIVLAQNKSKLMLFGFDIDPWQTTPVMVLGILTGLMGLQAAGLIEDRLKKKDGDSGHAND